MRSEIICDDKFRVALTKTIKNNEKATNESLNRIRMNKAAVTRNEKEKVEYLKKFDLDEKNLHTKISELVYKLPEKIGEIVKKLQKDKLRGYLDFFYEFSLCMNPSLKDDVRSFPFDNFEGFEVQVCRVLEEPW